MKKEELIDLRDFAVSLAREAGAITLRHFNSETSVERKIDGSFVTAADREAEAFLRAQIKKRFPADGILGEEEGETPGSSGRRWILDPIDGTYSFVHGVPLYGVLIGVEQDDEPIAGVIYIPALKDMVYAAKGTGCFWNGEPARVSKTESLKDALLLATDFGVCDRYGFGAAANRLQASVHSRRTWADCYGYVLVATGRADIMFDPVMHVWDCAALLPVIEEAGGTFTDWKGTRTIHSGNSIATNGVLFEQVMSTIRG
jgi:histidinol-phosphatase